MAGTELLAFKEAVVAKDHTVSYKKLVVKPEEGRCNGCGNCCKSGHSEIILDLMFKTLGNYLMEHGKFSNNVPCPFQSQHGCILGSFIPFACIRSICTGYEGCTEYLE